MRVILASESPRRAELLKAAGFDIEVIPSRIDEDRHDGEAAEDYVLRVARAKADVAAHNRKDLPIVAADTVVVLDGHIMGKPKDDAEATRMLRMLGGRTHEVLTGVVVRLGGKQRGHVERTRVRMTPLSPAEIAWYIDTGEPRDKAGAYAVQGLASRFIEAIEGSYSNVVGLPVAAVYRLLRELVGEEGRNRIRLTSGYEQR
jgi:septum formation protein